MVKLPPPASHYERVKLLMFYAFPGVGESELRAAKLYRNKNSLRPSSIKPDAILLKALAYEKKLLRLDDAASLKLVEKKRGSRIFIDPEEQRFFNRPESLANEDCYRYWSKMAVWTTHQAAVLSLGRDPSRVSIDSIYDLRDISPFAKNYSDMGHLIHNAVENDVLHKSTPPNIFVEWAALNGIHPPRKKGWGGLGLGAKEDVGHRERDPLKGNQSFEYIENAARRAIKEYPIWKSKRVGKVKIKDVLAWLDEEFNVDTRRAEIIKDVLSDRFEDFP
jgi:hypothetical protein